MQNLRILALHKKTENRYLWLYCCFNKTPRNPRTCFPSHLSRLGSLPNLAGGNWKLLVINFLFYAVKCNVTSSIMFIMPITTVWLFAASLCFMHFHQFLKVPLSPGLNRPFSSFEIPKEHCFVYIQQSAGQDYTYARIQSCRKHRYIHAFSDFLFEITNEWR